MFTVSDFELYQPRFQGDEEWNGRRLEVRRHLQAMGDELKGSFKGEGIFLDRRESLHNPHHTNRKRVRRQRTMLFRDKKSRSALQQFLGKELGKDLDSARNNLHFQIVIEEREARWGLRLDEGAWYDLNALLKRAEEDPGRIEIVASCQSAATSFALEVDGGGARPLNGMDSRDWRDLAGAVRPGETQLEIVRRMPAPEAVALEDGFEELVQSELLSLCAFYRLACWSLGGPSGVSL
jgi:hypothetical protein